MPELPEVETVKNALSKTILGHRVTKVVFTRPDLRDPIPIKALKKILEKNDIDSVTRRSKYIIVKTKAGEMVVHLGMTGRFQTYETADPQEKHTHAIFGLRSKKKDFFVHFIDPRRFGRIGAMRHGADKWFEQLGPEPLAKKFDLGLHLYESSRNRKVPVKNFIMDSRTVVGVGNIYAAEALFLSSIRPKKAAHRVTRKEYERLGQSIKKVLNDAIKAGGTSFRDFKSINGQSGYFAINLNVYGREGAPCKVCGHTIQKIVLAGRSSCFCQNCQK